MSTVEHSLQLDCNVHMHHWVSMCSCDRFMSPPCETEEDAIEAWDDHCDVVFMESTMDGAA